MGARDYYFIALPLAIFYFLLALLVGVLKLMSLNGILQSPPLLALFPHHGELMVFGFLGTLIPVERYVGSRSMSIPGLIHVMPFLTSIGALFKLVSWLTKNAVLNAIGTIAIAIGIFLYLALLAYLSKLSAEKTSFRLMGAGALSLLLALLVSTLVTPVLNLPLALLMLAFPALTILGERVELSKFTMHRIGIEAQVAGMLFLASLLFAILLRNYFLLLLASLIFLALAAYIMRSEKLVFGSGIKGYLSLHLLAAYAWVFLGFVLASIAALADMPQRYFDPAVHSISVGFILGMIYAHAPVVIPAMLGRKLDETKLTLLPLALLTLGNILRIIGHVAKISLVAGYSSLLVLLSLLLLTLMVQSATRQSESG